MDRLKQYEPLFQTWYIKKLIGQGSFGRVYEIERTELDNTYRAALKVITIPQNESEIKSIMADGMSVEDVTGYYKTIVKEIVDEFVMMSRLKGNSNVVSYEDHILMEHEDGIGWDILIRMELLTSLLDHTAKTPLQEDDVIKLGIDLCKALELCRKHNIIHRDIKPENIFVSENGDYKLGDFGIAKTVEKTSSGLSRKGTYSYMAPEAYKGEAYGALVDIYSLGIVMYRFLNDNRTPFMPDFPKPITYQDRENALLKRIGGEQLTPPKTGSSEIQKIILKACAYEPKNRYASAEEMRMELEALVWKRRKGGNETEKVKEHIYEEEPTCILDQNESFDMLEKTESLFEEVSIPEKLTEPVEKTESGFGDTPISTTKAPKQKRKTGKIAGVAAVILVLAAALICVLGTNGVKDITAESTILKNPQTENGVTTWDCIYFGDYPQKERLIGGFKTEPIKWRVLSVKGDNAFLLADKNLDYQPYNTELKSVTWKTSTLRKWLNDEFINTAFTEEEQKAIKTTSVVNKKNPRYSTKAGEDTRDKVYLLSIGEVLNAQYGFTSSDGYASDDRRAGVNTEYVAQSSTMNDEGSRDRWWLRSPGYNLHSAAAILKNGTIYFPGNDVDAYDSAVRPVLHLDLSSDVWSYAGTVTSE